MNQLKRATILSTKKQKILWAALVVVLLGLIAVIVVIKPQPEPVQGEPLITYSTDTPSESPQEASAYDWKGDAAEPKRIIIDRLGVSAYVQKMGVDQHGKIAVPNNVHLSGWFADSVKPGQNGLSIIAGHVSGRANDGVFKQLESLQIGDTFAVELGSGDTKHYKVTQTTKVPEPQAASLLFSQNPKVKSQVNLITCAGDYNQTTAQFADRVIVSGELQN